MRVIGQWIWVSSKLQWIIKTLGVDFQLTKNGIGYLDV